MTATASDEVFPTACLCEQLRRASRVVTRIYDEALRPAELRITQFSLLSVLAKHDAIRIRDLAAGVFIDETAVLRNLRPLTDRELVAIEPGEDRRERYASMTAQGRELFLRAAPLWKAAQKALKAQLPGPIWDAMFRGLPTIARIANEPAGA
jgi:DNA-binding MarR family transcriptional regulator